MLRSDASHFEANIWILSNENGNGGSHFMGSTTTYLELNIRRNHNKKIENLIEFSIFGSEQEVVKGIGATPSILWGHCLSFFA